MSRRRSVKKRAMSSDARYNHRIIAQFINYTMMCGKKSVAEKIVYEAISFFAERLNAEPVECFEQAVANVRPVVEVRSRRVGGATYQVPVEVYESRAISLALRWIIKAAAARKVDREKPKVTSLGKKCMSIMSYKLASELLDAYNKRGGAVKRCEDTHKMAESNKAFAHYRW